MRARLWRAVPHPHVIGHWVPAGRGLAYQCSRCGRWYLTYPLGSLLRDAWRELTGS